MGMGSKPGGERITMARYLSRGNHMPGTNL
jgi:hypothetical protein